MELKEPSQGVESSISCVRNTWRAVRTPKFWFPPDLPAKIITDKKGQIQQPFTVIWFYIKFLDYSYFLLNLSLMILKKDAVYLHNLISAEIVNSITSILTWSKIVFTLKWFSGIPGTAATRRSFLTPEFLPCLAAIPYFYTLINKLNWRILWAWLSLLSSFARVTWKVSGRKF